MARKRDISLGNGGSAPSREVGAAAAVVGAAAISRSYACTSGGTRIASTAVRIRSR